MLRLIDDLILEAGKPPHLSRYAANGSSSLWTALYSCISHHSQFCWEWDTYGCMLVSLYRSLNVNKNWGNVKQHWHVCGLLQTRCSWDLAVGYISAGIHPPTWSNEQLCTYGFFCLQLVPLLTTNRWIAQTEHVCKAHLFERKEFQKIGLICRWSSTLLWHFVSELQPKEKFEPCALFSVQ